METRVLGKLENFWTLYKIYGRGCSQIKILLWSKETFFGRDKENIGSIERSQLAAFDKTSLNFLAH